jgi:hypothetical protein
MFISLLNNNDGIKYFCDLYEFGKFKDNNTNSFEINKIKRRKKSIIKNTYINGD